ncbi:HET-domain-containing protein [Rhizodiscina lignyota]|uniref:HET-domain-containing protein n=1 Tax=Rhizodiscina lignyota TaxID=1504668 RepID=A0A9P4MAK7_9PEZI|nr:HET-domain-containing protein [Rhizodiscina lignyota]
MHQNHFRGIYLDQSQQSLGVRLFYEDEQHLNQLSRVELWDTSSFDVTLVRSWISKCEQMHGDTCWNLPTAVPKNFRLIDVEKSCITLVAAPVRYVALSYVWNTAHGNDVQLTRSTVDVLSQASALTTSALPDAITDALSLCSDLGKTYMWIDRLCIVQDGVDKHGQIQVMDEIYGKAAFTIVAATERADVTGLPGVRGRERRPTLANKTRQSLVEGDSIKTNFESVITKSLWCTRGWTFQEGILSPRILYVTDHQVYFRCSKCLVEEEAGISAGHRRLTKSKLESHRQSNQPLGDRDINSKIDYIALVKDYTARNFSFEADVLNAFAGVSNVLAATLQTQFLFGIPENLLLSALLWEARHHERRKGVPHIPSWSWAAWTGAINIGIRDLMAAKIIGILVKLYVQDHKKRPRPVRLESQEKWWFSSPIDFRTTHTVQPSYGYAALPEEFDSIRAWRAGPHNPWSMLDHEELDSAARREARKRPGCLVFNTTFARLAMEKRDGAEGDGENSLEFYLYTTNDDQNLRIGKIALTRILATQMLQHGNTQCFIVICAALLGRYHRRALRKGPWHNSPVPTTVWQLCVMLVDMEDRSPDIVRRTILNRKRGSTHVVRRVGMGYVDMDLWRLANPCWTTIVLE